MQTHRSMDGAFKAFLCAGILTSGAAWADAEDPSHLEEIVVVAQKRSENLQNVPIAVSVVTASKLEQAGADGLLDVRTVVPSLNLTNSDGRFTPSLRGIGTTGVGAGVENPVALYVDGVYYASTVASLLSLNNIRQVEVLKGPQGTLFGRNATGGLIQVLTRDPTQELSGSADITYGNFNTEIARGYLSGGLTDKLGADVAIFAKRQGDGWGHNLFTGQSIDDIDHDVAVRSKWRYSPFDATNFTFIADYSDSRDSDTQLIAAPGKINPFAPGIVQPDLGYNTNTTGIPAHVVKSGGVSLRWDQGIGDLSLASISAFRRSSIGFGNDLDGVPADLGSFYYRQFDRQFSQELQLSSASSGKLKWTAGLYYFRSRATAPLPDINFSFAGFILGLDGVESADSKAGYGQLTYEIMDATNLTLGGRYTSEERFADDQRQTVTPRGSPMTFVTTYPNEKATFDKFTYRVSLDHRFNADTLMFVSANRGFKSGGYNTIDPGAPAFKPEILDAYELGIKNDLFNRRLRLNASLYYDKYQDIQVSEILAAGYTTVNGGTARTYGLDADLTAALTEHLNLVAGALVQSARFRKYEGCPVGAPLGGLPLVPGSCDGNTLPLAAKNTFSLAMNYRVAVGQGSITSEANAYYNSGFPFESDNVIRQGGFTEFGASTRWQAAEKGLSVSLYGRNLSDRRILNYGITQTTGAQIVSWAQPRTYGITVGYDF